MAPKRSGARCVFVSQPARARNGLRQGAGATETRRAYKGKKFSLPDIWFYQTQYNGGARRPNGDPRPISVSLRMGRLFEIEANSRPMMELFVGASRVNVSRRFTFWFCLAVCLVVSLPGCRGCLGVDPTAEREKRKKEVEELAEKKKKKPKEDFEVLPPEVLTTDETILQNMVKPGHWVSATQKMVANNFDFQADLETATVDRGGAPIELEHAPFGLRMSRPAALPKGQAKSFESHYYIPRRIGVTSQAPWMESKLQARRTGREVFTTSKPTLAMPSYQYYLLVLSRNPDRYGYLKAPYMASIRPPTDSFEEDSLLYYRVILPQIGKVAPVPSHSLTWTSIAYVVWDDLDATVLTPDQQQAMLDWLHWGGQLIISGPKSLNLLRRSFLTDYLPAEEIKAADLTAASFAEVNEHFALEIASEKTRPKLEPAEGKPIAGAELQLNPKARWVPHTGQMLAERQVGRGRVVVTAFPLTDRAVVNWPSFDNFFNACLLRRPAREFQKGDSEMLTVRWRDYPDLTRDPRLVASLRYFSRDIDYPAGRDADKNIERELTIARERQEASGTGLGSALLGVDVSSSYSQPVHLPNRHPDSDDVHFGGFLGRTQSGVAGWTDFSGAAHVARTSLQEAAGIDVPESDFVLKVMAVYLFVLAPLNWAFFRILGRVEWAWVAAPILAIIGAIAVVRVAQLDIGFARSRTEVAILETHGGYSRGHLTRYTALYTSLSTSYTLAFEDHSALAAPFSVDPEYARLRHQSVTPVYFQRGRDVRLSGFPVQSNSTNMVHSEQMYSLGDGVKLIEEGSGAWKVENRSELPLHGVGVYRRTENGEIEAAWIGELGPNMVKTLTFRSTPGEPGRFKQWEESPTTATITPQGEVSLSPLIDLVIQRLRLRRGDVRLLGWTDASPEGMEITPKASQQVFRTLVLSHLQHGDWQPPQSDVNHRKDVVSQGAREPLTDADFERDEQELPESLGL